jgi:hypothetical protein
MVTGSRSDVGTTAIMTARHGDAPLRRMGRQCCVAASQPESSSCCRMEPPCTFPLGFASFGPNRWLRCCTGVTAAAAAAAGTAEPARGGTTLLPPLPPADDTLAADAHDE